MEEVEETQERPEPLPWQPRRGNKFWRYALRAVYLGALLMGVILFLLAFSFVALSVSVGGDTATVLVVVILSFVLSAALWLVGRRLFADRWPYN